MKCTVCHFILASSSLFAAVALTGCATPASTQACGETTVSLAVMGPATNAPVEAFASEDVFYLGAGDELGRQIFTRYVASLNREEYFATGVSEFPSRD